MRKQRIALITGVTGQGRTVGQVQLNARYSCARQRSTAARRFVQGQVQRGCASRTLFDQCIRFMVVANCDAARRNSLVDMASFQSTDLRE